MKVLEIIKEVEFMSEPKLGPNGKPLKITEPKLGPNGKPLKITDPNKKSKLAPTTGSNWQQKLLSEEAWKLVFYTNGYPNNRPPTRSDIEDFYRRFIIEPEADYPIGWLRNKMQTMANVMLDGRSPEDVVNNIIKDIQNKLGITIGPSWKINDLRGQTVKDVDLVKNFLIMLRADVSSSSSDDQTTKNAPVVPRLDNNAIQGVAMELAQALKDKKGDKVYSVLQSIKPVDFERIADAVPDYFTKGNVRDSSSTFVDKIKANFKDYEDKALLVKIDEQLIRLGVIDKKGNAVILGTDNPFKWIVGFKPGDKIDNSTLKKERAEMVKLSAQINKWKLKDPTDTNENPPLKDLAIWAAPGGTGGEFSQAAMDSFNAEVRKLRTKQKPTPLQVRQVVGLWSKYYYGSIKRSYNTYQ